MSQFEYKVVPAPKRGEKAKGLKTAEDRFAHTLQTAMNALARQGWEYQRTDTLPSEERSGFTGRVTTYQNMLVFRREVVAMNVAATPARVEVTTVTPPVAEAPKLAPKPLDVDPARAEPQIASE